MEGFWGGSKVKKKKGGGEFGWGDRPYGVLEQMACLSLSLFFGDVRWELERPLSIPLEARDR